MPAKRKNTDSASSTATIGFEAIERDNLIRKCVLLMDCARSGFTQSSNA